MRVLKLINLLSKNESRFGFTFEKEKLTDMKLHTYQYYASKMSVVFNYIKNRNYR